MSQKILNLAGDLHRAAARTEGRCRSLMRDLRALNKNPVSFPEVLKLQLIDANGRFYGGVVNDVEAQMLLECDLHACS